MRLLIATGYLVACLLWIYGPASSDQTDGIWWLVALGLLQPAFGVLVGRCWAVPVPIALVPMSIPAGSGSGELPLWFGVMSSSSRSRDVRHSRSHETSAA
jgi:hypothetical protein